MRCDTAETSDDLEKFGEFGIWHIFPVLAVGSERGTMETELEEELNG